MRTASKNILYAVVNSRAYEGDNYKVGLKPWQIAFVIVNVILAIGLIILELHIIKGYKLLEEDTEK